MKTPAEFGRPEFILVDFRNLTDISFYAPQNQGLSVTYEDKETGQQRTFPTGAIYGFVKKVMDTLREFSPDARVLVAKEGGRTFRSELDTGYKGTRKPTPDDLKAQFGPLSSICRNFGWSVLSVDGYEADDLLATWANCLNQEGRRGLIVSHDKDLFTHITPTLGALRRSDDGRRNAVMGPEDVIAKHGVPPQLNSQYLAIVGDGVDEIKGLPGVGKKKAPELLNKYGSIDGIYAHLEDLPKGLREKFENGKAELEKSLKLATLVSDLPEALAVLREPAPTRDMNALQIQLEKLKMESILTRIAKNPENHPSVPGNAGQANPPAKGLQQELLF
jgi:DNA polymerase-1